MAVMHTKPQVGVGKDCKQELLLQLIKVYNKKTDTYKEYNIKQAALTKDEKLVVAVQLYTQDYSLQLSNQVARVLYVSDSP